MEVKKIRIRKKKQKRVVTVCSYDNIACNKNASQSSQSPCCPVGLAVNGIFESRIWITKSIIGCSHTSSNDLMPWLKIDLGKLYLVEKVIILGRDEFEERMDYFIVGLDDQDKTPKHGEYELCGQWSGKAIRSANMTVYCSYNRKPSRYIIVQQPKWSQIGALTVCELQAFGVEYSDNFICPIGLYNKPLCEKVCHCANELPCDQITGKCDNGCSADWSGQNCDLYKYEWKDELVKICVLDKENITNLKLTTEEMTISICIEKCFDDGYAFAALYNGNECHCGNEIYEILLIKNANCNVKCSGNTSLECGGKISSNYKQFYRVCPPNYFGFKCRFKSRCANIEISRYPDGKCNNENNCDNNNIIKWIPPTCHIRICPVNDTCDKNGICDSIKMNNKEVFFCRCNKGYEYFNDTCTDVNECINNKHTCSPPSQICINTIGNYNCLCNKGYKLINTNCIDDDECLMPNICTINETCTNLPGSYSCNLIIKMQIGKIIGGIVFILFIIIIILIYKKFKNYQNTDIENYSRIVFTKNEEQEKSSEIINNSNDILMLNNNVDENQYSKMDKEDNENEINLILHANLNKYL